MIVTTYVMWKQLKERRFVVCTANSNDSVTSPVTSVLQQQTNATMLRVAVIGL